MATHVNVVDESNEQEDALKRSTCSLGSLKYAKRTRREGCVKPLRRAGREILAHHRAHVAGHRQSDHQPARLEHSSAVVPADAMIDGKRHQRGDKNLENRLDQLKNGPRIISFLYGLRNANNRFTVYFPAEAKRRPC